MAEGYIESVGAKLGNAMKEMHASILKARNDLERHSIEGLNVDVDGSSCEAVLVVHQSFFASVPFFIPTGVYRTHSLTLPAHRICTLLFS